METKSEELYQWLTTQKPIEFDSLTKDMCCGGEVFIFQDGKFIHMYNSLGRFEPIKRNIFQKIILALKLVFKYE